MSSVHENEIYKKIVKKAWEDKEFKKKLLGGEPKKALEEEFGIHIPENIKLKVVEEEEDTVCLVIPAEPKDVNNELDCAVSAW